MAFLLTFAAIGKSKSTAERSAAVKWSIYLTLHNSGYNQTVYREELICYTLSLCPAKKQL